MHKVERTVHSTEERINQLTDQLAAESKKAGTAALFWKLFLAQRLQVALWYINYIAV